MVFAQHLSEPLCHVHGKYTIQLAENLSSLAIGSTIYSEWNDANSTEPQGWYRCTVSDYNSSGEVRSQN